MRPVIFPLSMIMVAIATTVMAAGKKPDPPLDPEGMVYRNSPNIGPNNPVVDLSELTKPAQAEIRLMYRRLHNYLRFNLLHDKHSRRLPPRTFSQAEIDTAKQTLNSHLKAWVRDEREKVLQQLDPQLKEMKEVMGKRQKMLDKAQRMADDHAHRRVTSRSSRVRAESRRMEGVYRDQVKEHRAWLDRYRTRYEKLVARKEEWTRELEAERKAVDDDDSWVKAILAEEREPDKSEAVDGPNHIKEYLLTPTPPPAQRQQGRSDTAKAWLGHLDKSLAKGIEGAPKSMPPSGQLPRGPMGALRLLNA